MLRKMKRARVFPLVLIGVLSLAGACGKAQTYTVLHAFTNSLDGAHPFAGLVLSGSALYGTTESGGISNRGTIFRVSTNGDSYAVLKNFTGSDGAGPDAAVVLSGNTL